jgi:hypothetical protein
MEHKGDPVFTELHDRLTKLDNQFAMLPRRDAEEMRNATASISVWLARAEAKPYVLREPYVKQIVAEIEDVESRLRQIAS